VTILPSPVSPFASPVPPTKPYQSLVPHAAVTAKLPDGFRRGKPVENEGRPNLGSAAVPAFTLAASMLEVFGTQISLLSLLENFAVVDSFAQGYQKYGRTTVELFSMKILACG